VNAQERARIYQIQLESIKNERSRARFLDWIADTDPAAKRLMR